MLMIPSEVLQVHLHWAMSWPEHEKDPERQAGLIQLFKPVACAIEINSTVAPEHSPHPLKAKVLHTDF